MKKLSLFVVFMILVVFNATILATTYYVDSQSGNDSNNGTSITSAWKSTNKVNSMIFQAGDQILYKRGLTYIGFVEVENSGNSTAPIIYGNYGEGNLPVIDVNNQSSLGFSVNNNSNIIIDGFRIINFNNVVSGGGVRIIGGTNVTVKNCEIHVTGRAGVFIEGSKNTLIKNNKMTTPNYSYPVQTDGIYMQRNSGSVLDGNHIVTSNLDPAPHVDGIQMYQENSPKIMNNYVEIASNCEKYQGIYADHCTGNFEIYNNVVVGMNQISSLLKFKNSGVGTATAKVIGNTLYGGRHGLFHTDDPNIVFKNNIVVTTGNYFAVYFQTAINNKSNISNNIYNTGGSGAVVYFVSPSLKKEMNMKEWESLGYDANSIQADPMFTNVSGRDFSLKTTSPAINKGFTFTNPFNVDKNGIIRPAGSFDMGAFEVQTALSIEDEQNNNIQKTGNMGTPDKFELGQNYPNPFNPSTSIKYALPKEMMVSLKVYDILGKEVATLVNEEKAAGHYEVNFNAAGLASGTYIYRLETGNMVDVKKMILMK